MIYGYVRVSTVGQALYGNGLEAQTASVKAAGAEEIVEDVYTGTTTNRPGLQALLPRLKSGDTLVCVKIDRLARSVSDGCKLISDLLERGVAVHILNLGRVDDTPAGKLTWHVMLAFAEYEKDVIKERLAAGREVAKKRPDFHEGRPKKYAPERIEAALEMIRGGKSYTKAAAASGISRSTLLRAMKEARKSEVAHE